jgi:hypothetical protein
MFRSLMYDHPQGSSFVLSAITSPLASFVQLFIWYVAVCCLQCNVCIENDSLVLFTIIWRNWSIWRKQKNWLSYVCVFPKYLSVGCLVVNCLLCRISNWTKQTIGEVVKHQVQKTTPEDGHTLMTETCRVLTFRNRAFYI